MSSSSKQVKTVKNTYVIENFLNSAYKDFPKFKLSSNDKFEFNIAFHPNRKCEFYNENYTIILFALKSIAEVSNKTIRDAYFGHYQTLRAKIIDPGNRLLVDDKLTIYCEVEKFDVKSQTVNELFNLTKNPVLKNYKTLLDSAKFSDVALIIGEKQLPVHKAILGAQSKVFAAMFENDCKEKRQNRVEITDISVGVCKQMVRYIYTGQVDELDEYAAELFVAADKYQLDHLKEACEQHMATSIETDSVANILLVADMHNASLLKTKCIEYVIEHGKEVIASEGWKVLTKARPELVIQLFEQIYNQK